MNETKHTPGPWLISTYESFGNVLSPHSNCKVAMVYDAGVNSKGVGVANARLISAAPELLKLLKDCHNVLFQFPDYQEGNLCDDVKSAIAKAEGSAQ